MRLIVVLGLAGLLARSATAATPITYAGAIKTEDIATRFRITTDGTIGSLGEDNIADYSFTLTVDGTDRLIQKDLPGGLLIEGAGLIATDTELLFAFSPLFARAVFFTFHPDGSQVIFGFYGNDPQGMAQAAFYDASGDRDGQASFTGLRAIAGAVPENGTWVMMIAGFGAIGAAMRRRATVTVRFD